MPAKSKPNQDRARKGAKTAVRAQRRPRAETTVTVTFRHVAPTTALTRYAERKPGRISKFLKRPAQAHLILEVDKYRQCGEVTVKSGRIIISAQEIDKDLYAVIDLLTAKVRTQIKRHMEKLEARKVRAPSAVELLSEPEASAVQTTGAQQRQ